MARSSTGKWVARAGATGGGRTYRGQVPANWYAALVIIVVIGLGSIIYSRYEYRHPSTAPTVQPTVGTIWYAGFDFDICGTQLPAPAADTSAKGGITTGGMGVIQIAPTTAAEAGNNATLGRFVSGYKGMQLTSDQVQAPGSKLYHNGDTCPKGTPDAGKAGQVKVAYWSSPANSTKSTLVSGNPADLKFGPNSLLTIGFVPPDKSLPRPPASTVLAVLQAASAVASTTTTTPAATTTTAPANTTTSTT
jgi:hypothetical protein